MNIIAHLSLQSMKKNKTTTLITILGIIMSLALMSGLFLFSNSLLQFLRDDYVERHGETEIIFPLIDQASLDARPQLSMVDQQTRLAYLGVSPNEKDLATVVLGYDPNNAEGLNLTLAEGRIAQAAGEIVVTPRFLQATEHALGDSFELTLSQPEHFIEIEASGLGSLTPLPSMPVTIVGVFKNNPMEYPLAGPLVIAYQTQEAIKSADTVWAGFTLKELSDETIRQFVEGQDKYSTTDLTAYSPRVSSKAKFYIQSFAYALMVIVALAGIGLIQNGFLISLSQRMKELSILSSIGMTHRQKWRLSLIEGMILFLIALPIGLGSGFLAMSIVFRILTPLLQNWSDSSAVLRLTWDWPMLAQIVGAGFITVLIATIIPAVRTSRTTPLVGVRQQEELTITAKGLRSPGLISRLFGLEGELAWKNLKRNQRRYRATLISLVFSLVLYLSLASLIYYTTLSSDVQMSRGKEDVVVELYGSRMYQQRPLIEEMLATPGIEQGMVVFSSSQLLKDTQGLELNPELNDLDYGLTIEILSFDDATLTQYLKEWGLKPEELAGSKAVLVNQTRTRADDGRYITKPIFLEEPEQIKFEMFDPEQPQEVEVEVVKVLPDALIRYNSWLESLVLVVSKDTFDQWMASTTEPSVSATVRIFTQREAHKQVMDSLAETVVKNFDPYQLSDLRDMNQRQRDFITVSKILVFGFATIIALIGLANIYNSLMSSLRFRRKEFAMLRSVGMEEKSFQRMIRFESYFYALKLLSYSIPLGVLTSYGIYRYIIQTIEFNFRVPMLHFGLASLSVVVVLITIMHLGSRTVRQENILDTLKTDMDL